MTDKADEKSYQYYHRQYGKKSGNVKAFVVNPYNNQAGQVRRINRRYAGKKTGHKARK
jgi:hypothetical protein